MLSHNRFVFATSFAILAMTAVGLDAIWRGEVRRHWWHWLPAGLLVCLCFWSIHRARVLPEPIATQVEASIQQGHPVQWIHNLGDVAQLKTWFVRSASGSAILCGLGIIGWLILWFRPLRSAVFVAWIAVLLTGDLLWFAHGRSAQSDPALYYPRIPALEQIASASPGRALGFDCLPAALAQMASIRDLRGYDGVDPGRLMNLMTIAADPAIDPTNIPPYALTQWFRPGATFRPPDGVNLSPILDLLNVRYVVFRGTPPAGIQPVFKSPDYWVLVNHRALPRVFVPARVELVVEDRERLDSLGSPTFDARQVAYVETPVNLPSACRGTAEIVSEIPARVTVGIRMETPGLVVLADLWDRGWHAYLDGKPAPILRANQALRGVVVPAGNATLEFRYEPASLAWGYRLAALAVAILLAWFLTIISPRWLRLSTAPRPPAPTG
jgi:hypothetical protein